MTSSAKKTTPAKLMATQSPVESLSVARSNAPDMLVPSNAEAEQAVLGSLVIDPDAALVVEPILKETDFYFEKHRWIFAVCLRLHRAHSPIDFLTVIAELEKVGQLTDVGGAAYVTSLINAVPSALHVAQYAQLVRATSVQRRLIRAATEIAAVGYDPERRSTEELLAFASQKIAAVSNDALTDEGWSFSDALSRLLDQVEAYVANPKQVWGIPTGFDLDQPTGGWHRKQLFVLSGDPGSGKTAWLLDAAVNAARAGYHGILFSLEMSVDELMMRLIADRTGISATQIKRGQIDSQDMAEIARQTGELGELPLCVYDMPTNTATLQAIVARRVQQGQCDFVIVDYSKLVLDEGEQEALRLGNIARSIKTMAKRLNVAAVLVHPSSRAPSVQNRRPDMADLGWSWDVVYHTDVLVFVWRDKSLPPQDLTRELVIVKNRNGATLPVAHIFDPMLTRWSNLAPER